MALSSIAMCSRLLFPSPRAMASPSSSPALPPDPLHRPTSLPASISSPPTPSPLQIVHPSLQFANLLWFKGTFNAQVFVGENEAPDSVVRRFRRAVMQAGVISECRRRRFFETPQDIQKRKKQASQRKRSRTGMFSEPEIHAQGRLMNTWNGPRKQGARGISGPVTFRGEPLYHAKLEGRQGLQVQFIMHTQGRC